MPLGIVKTVWSLITSFRRLNTAHLVQDLVRQNGVRGFFAEIAHQFLAALASAFRDRSVQFSLVSLPADEE